MLHEKKNSKEERISRTNDIAIAKRRLPISQPNQATAEETALAGEKRMNPKIDTLLSNLHDGLMIIDRNYTIIYANERLTELCGSPAGGIIGNKCHMVFHGTPSPCDPSTLQKKHCPYREVFTKGQPVTLEHHHLMPDGSTRIFAIFAAALKDKKGTPARVIQVLRDITVEKKLRDELADSHQSLELIFTNVPFTLCLIDKEMRVVRMNPAMEALAGIRTEKALGQYCYDCWGQYAHDANRHGREKICEGCHVPSALANGEKHRHERRVGGRIIEVVSSPVRDADGMIIGAMEMGQDITERRQAEDKLRESDERLRLIAETISEAFWMADVEIGKNFYISPAYERIWGRSLQSLRENPRSFIEAVHPDDVVRVLAKLELQKTGQPFDNKYRIRRPDGTIRWIWDRAFPVHEPSGEVLRYVGIAQDITECHEFQLALQKSENNYRVLFESSPNVLGIANFSGIRQYLAEIAPRCKADHERFLKENPEELAVCVSRLRITTVNQAALALLGAISQQELIEGLFKVIGPETVSKATRGISAIGRGESSFEDETVLYHLQTRAKIYCVLRWNVVPGYEDNYQKVILSLTDISARKIAEDKLADYSEQLRRLSARLIETEETERRHIARELHDTLGQCLTVLGVNLHILRQDYAPEPNSEQGKRIDDSIILIEEMTEKVRDIMSNLRPSMLDDYGLDAALRWYGAIFGKRFGIPCVMKGTNIPRMPATVEMALFRVVQEALNNVAKHSQATRVEIRSALRGERLSLVVHDNGKGFSKADNTDMPEAVRLGLISMGERVESVGGKLAVTSASGVGTVVSVEIGI